MSTRNYSRRSHLRKRSMQPKQNTTSFPVVAFAFMVLALAMIVWMVMHPR